MKTKSETRRQIILKLAKEVFQEMGFERTSMDEISRRGGGSKATIYNYFANKEELFAEVIYQSASAQFESTHAALNLDGAEIGDIAPALENFGQHFLAMLYSDELLSFRRLLVAEGGRGGLGQKCYELGPARSEAMIAEFLQKAMSQGKLRQADARLAGNHFRGLLESELFDKFLFHTIDTVSKEEIASITHRAVTVFLAAYGPAKKQPRRA